MRKYLIFILLIIGLGLPNAYAASNDLIQCDYNAKVVNKDYYVKFRIIYHEDGTITQLMPQNGSEEYTEGQNSRNFTPTVFNVSDNSVNNTFPMTQSNFSEQVMKEAYEKGSCPYLAFNNSNYTITPMDDNSLNGFNSYLVTAGTTTLFNEEGEAEIPEEPVITTTCTYKIPEGTFDTVPGFTINFLMYDNGEKYVEAYVTSRGSNYAQKALVSGNNGIAVRAQATSGDPYTISIASSDLAKIFSQTEEQISTNQFTCPSESDLNSEEVSFTDRTYQITAVSVAEDPIIDSGMDFTADDCESYLGDPEKAGTPAYYLDFIFDLIKYAAIVILLILSIFEFIKATASSNQDAMKKALQITLKRLLIAVIIFFVPSIIMFLLELFGIAGASTCGIA